MRLPRSFPRFDPDKNGDMAAQTRAPVPRGQLRDVLDDGGDEPEAERSPVHRLDKPSIMTGDEALASLLSLFMRL